MNGNRMMTTTPNSSTGVLGALLPVCALGHARESCITSSLTRTGSGQTPGRVSTQG